MRNLGCLLIPLLVLMAIPAYSDPNSVREVVFQTKNDSLVSKTYINGFGNTLQKQYRVPGKTGNVIVHQLYDSYNRPVNTTLPLMKSRASNSDYEAYAPFATTDTSNCNYSSVNYYNDPLQRIKAAGLPSKILSINPDVGHPIKKWTIARLSADFIDTYTHLSDTNYLNTQETVPPANAKYFLDVSMDANSHFSQAIRDLSNNTIKQRIYSAPGDAYAITSSADYDVAGHVLHEYPPRSANDTELVGPTSYTYSTTGKLLTKVSPERSDWNFYDSLDRLWTSGNQKFDDDASIAREGASRHLTYAYDELNRLVTISLSKFTGTTYKDFVKVRYIYDRPGNARGFIPENAIPWASLNQLTFTKGKLVAQIGYGENYDYSVAESTNTNKVIQCFGYSEDNRLQDKYIYIPGLPWQRIFTNYNLQGAVTNVSLTNSAQTSSTGFSFLYDKNARLSTVQYAFLPGNAAPTLTTVVKYLYNDTNNLLSQKQFFKIDGTPMTIDYGYNQCGWLKSIVGKNGSTSLLSEVLFYQDAPAGFQQYNGNIGASYYQQNNSQSTTSWTQAHHYDYANRLDSVLSDNADFSARITYDNAGRIVDKREGSTFYQGYSYSTFTNNNTKVKTSQLAYVNSSMIKRGFVFDANSNLVYDPSKLLVIKYDWRDMPTEFDFVNSLPPTTVNTAVGIYQWLNTNQSFIASKVLAVYDADGQRVLKTTYTGTIQQPTASTAYVDDYSVYELASGAYVQKYVNIPGSEGRVDLAKNKTLYYIKDHLGSTRNVIDNTGAVNEAVGYKAYGTQVPLVTLPSTSVLTKEKFTGKEYDQEPGPFSVNGNPYSQIVFNIQFTGFNTIITGTGRPYGEIDITLTDGTILRRSFSCILLPNNGYTFKLLPTDPYDPFLFPGNKTIASISYVLRYPKSPNSTTIDDSLKGSLNVNMFMAAGKKLTLTTLKSRSELESNPNAAIYTYATDKSDYFNGICLDYYGARYYDPDLGIFTSADPKRQYFNPYAYCGGNPVNLVDPNGEWGWVAGLIGGAAIGGSIGFVAGGLSDGHGWNWDRAWAGFGIGTVIGGAAGFFTSENFINYVGRPNRFLTDDELLKPTNDLFAAEQRGDYVYAAEFTDRDGGPLEAGVHSPDSYARSLGGPGGEAEGSIQTSRSVGTAEHHMVAQASPKAAEARQMLNKFGLDVQSSANKVSLPATRTSEAIGMYHPSLHTDVYYRQVNAMLRTTTSQADVLDVLGTIRSQLLQGTFPR